jgi:hypothetical protein
VAISNAATAERNIYPERSRYFVKDDFPYEKIPQDFPEPVIINSKSKRLVFKNNNDGIVTSDHHFHTPSINSASKDSNSNLHKCNLCNVFFKIEDELKNHVLEDH